MSVASNWKKHEQSVADFFLSERNYDHLTHRSRTSKEVPSDVLVNLETWLTAIGHLRKLPPEPYDKLLVECKYRGANSDQSVWLRKFFKFVDGIPDSVDTNKRRPLLVTPDGWLLCRLAHFYGVYRAVYTTELPFQVGFNQLSRAFWIQTDQSEAPDYFADWLDVTADLDEKKHGRILPIVCLGSSSRRKGPGGGKIVIARI